jgi:amino-acid N-acetyltransferase
MKTEEATPYRESIIELLASEKLPVADLPATLENFIVAKDNDEVTGVAGLEIYGDYGLLRSLAVSPSYRNKGIAKQLLNKIEALAASKSLHEIYLLTETAPEYFSQNGYHQITRADVPAQVKQSSEFSYACPQSAIVMKKTLKKP